jgi:hypothetical protein
MPWTAQIGATTQSLKEWGISNAVVTLNSFAASTLSFQLAGNFDAALLCDYAAALTLRDAGNVVRFIGRRRKAPQRVAGSDESRSYIFEDVLGDLNRRTLLQDWQMWTGSALTATPQGVATLFVDASGAGMSIAAQLTSLITSAASAGVSVQLGSMPTLTEIPRVVDISGKTYLEALKLCSRFAPDLGTWVDYSTTPPTLNFTRRVSATEHSIAVIDQADEFEAEPLEDAQPSGIIIRYEKSLIVDGVTMNASYEDVAPEGASATAENALNAHCVLRATRIGSAPRPARLTQTQSVTTVAIDPESFSFWESLWPALAGRNLAATLEDGSLSDAGYRMITAGAQPDWTGAAAVVSVSVMFNGTIDGEVYVNHILTAQVNASTLTTGDYTRHSGGESDGEGDPDPGESVPTGIAALLWASLGPLQWSGRHKRAETELSDWSIKPGHLLNFTGTAEARHSTARAQVQSVVYDLDNASRELVFGQSPTLLFDDLIELLRSQSTLSVGTRAAERAGLAEAPAQSVAGSGMGPGWNLIQAPRPNTHSFKGSRVGSTGNLYRVEGGQIDGYTIPAQNIDIGSSRPRAVAVVVAFDVLISNSEFMYNAILKTSGGSAPALAAGSGVSDAVTVSSSGTGAACVLFYVEATGAIVQLAHGNVVAKVNDDGSWGGTGVVVFEKNH